MSNQPHSHLVIGTAGHIDHGKTTLIKALTGKDTDRLREEKERGITIELGFAFYGDRAAFVDVPGHERLVKTMVAGAAAMRAALLVVAADDGVMPQTREHLAVLDALGVSRGIVAITKADLVSDKDWIDLVREDIRELLAPTSLADSPIVVTDALSGQGMVLLRAELDKLIDEAETPDDPGFFRMPVDRSFSLKGYGRIVTGTVWSGLAKAGDRLLRLPTGDEVRVRGLQTHESDVEIVHIGDRAALNLQTDSIPARGDLLISPGRGAASDFLDAELRLLPGARIVEHRQRIRLHFGTGEAIGRLLIVDGNAIAPGEQGFVRIALESPVAVMHGDRGVLRLYSPLETLGGVRVIDPDPVDRRRTIHGLAERLLLLAGRPEEALVAFVQSRKVVSLDTLKRLLPWSDSDITGRVDRLRADGQLIASANGSSWLVTQDYWNGLVEETLRNLESYHVSHPDEIGLPKGEWLERLHLARSSELGEALIRFLEQKGSLHYEDGRLVLAGHVAAIKAEDERDASRIEEVLLREGINVPLPTSIAEELGISPERTRSLLRSLKQVGRAVILAENVVLAKAVYDQAAETIRASFAESNSFVVGDAAKILGTTRKYIIPLLESFDSDQITRREGDTRSVLR